MEAGGDDDDGEISAPLIETPKSIHGHHHPSPAKSSSCSDGENSPIEQVALTVPTTDDPTLPAFTFRTLVLGTLSCCLLSFLNQFFSYRREPLYLTSIAAQIAAVPIGHLMASVLPRGSFFKGRRWEFGLNPGPFNVKEHVLITVFANYSGGNVYAMNLVTAVKVFYKKEMSFAVALGIILTKQLLGFGWAGVFRRYLVEPAAMWWPQNMVQVSLFRTLHEKEARPRGELTPQQLGSGLHGIGLGSIGLDWSTISSFLGSPLASPWFATANIAVGFALVTYVVAPLAYRFDVFRAKTFPIFSDGLFTRSGENYNISKIVGSDFHLDAAAYEREGPLYLSIFFVVAYGVAFASLTAVVVHVILFHGRELWELRRSGFKEKDMDVHSKLMRRYKQVPRWWFTCIIVLSITTIMFCCEYFRDQLQLPWWGVLLACALAIFITLPIGVITATTNFTPPLDVVTEYIIGYLYPEYPVANMLFKVYGYISMKQGIMFLQDFKLGHYMKIPPRAMFMTQVSATVIGSVVHLGTTWWLMATIPEICNRALLPAGSPWTCPNDHVFYDASVIWGLIGPRRIFGQAGHYSAVNWGFLVGAVAPLLVWLTHKAFPQKKWIRLITMPVILGATVNMPPATTVNYNSWILVGFFMGFITYRCYREWWSRHNYVLSAALDAGLTFMGVLLYMCLGVQHVSLDWWGSEPDRCPLATCPTAQGLIVKGCPVF